MKNRHILVTAWLLVMQMLLAYSHVHAQDDFKNNAFEYSVIASTPFYNPKVDKFTPNWNGSFKRFISSRSDRGGSFYLGLDYNSKLVFKHADSSGVTKIQTSSADFAFGFAIQNKLSTQYAGPVVKLFIGAPLENRDSYKLHFGAALQFNVNLVDFENMFGEVNLVGISVEIGAHGLVYEAPGVKKVLWSPTIGAGVAIRVPNKD
jgi:hypothetical protein